MLKEIISTSKAPAAIGPYSQAVKVGNLLFTSGQLPIVPETGEMVNSDAGEATERSIENLKEILEEAGSSLDKVIKTTIFLRDIKDFSLVNEVYAKYFTSNQPARSCFQVAHLPNNGIVEIEAVAYI